MERLILIDGNAILHRAYHALPPLTTSQGELVNAVFGFCSMLLRVIADLKPDYLVVTFDRPKPTFRKQLYVGYQAKRPKMAEDLTPQVDLVHQVLETMEVSVFEVDGFEADDVIGTLAKQTQDSKLKTQNLETIIVSGDRDLLQLVGERVKVYAPVSGLTQTVLYDEKAVEAKYGLKPSQIVDFKALVGDPSDNYPGVSGIGPKTASQLLQCFKTLEQIYQNLAKFSPKLAKSLSEGVEQAGLAKKLATIVSNVPIKLKLEDCRVENLDKPKVVKLFEDLGFKSLIPRLNGQNNGKTKDKKEKEPEKDDNEQLSLV